MSGAAPTDKAVSPVVVVTDLVTNAPEYARPGGVSGEFEVEVAPPSGRTRAELVFPP